MITNTNLMGKLPEQFNNPFTSISNRWMPTSMREVFYLSEWMYRYNSVFRGAIERLARLFITSYKYEKTENTTNLKLVQDYLENHNQMLVNIGIDYLIYGNSFLTLYLPFQRILRCSRCNKTFQSNDVELDFANNQFSGECPSGCGDVTFSFRDEPCKDLNKVNIVRIPPNQVEIIHNKISGNSTYFWDIPNFEKEKFRNGKGTILIKETPVDVLEAIFNDKKLEFKPGEIIHLAQPNLAGTNIEWGMPFTVSCFPIIFYIAVLRKANEAISMDYIIPLRIIHPSSSSPFQEASMMSLNKYVDRIREMIKFHRADPADYQISPVPIGYQVIGGEKRSLMITDDIKYSTEELLNSIGYFSEFFYGTANLQASPMSLKLMDTTFGLTIIYNQIIKWFLDKSCAYIGIDRIGAKLLTLNLSYNLELRQRVMELAGAQKVSDKTLLEMVGLDYQEEQEKKLDQEKIIANLTSMAQRDEARRNEMGGGGGGQDSGGSSGGGGMPTDPMGIIQAAQGMAQTMLQTPEDQRQSQLQDLLRTHPLLHDAVIGEMNRQRNKMRTQGMQMIQQQNMQQ